jgi:glycosyltransferase involved in cell wall biosynthesis
MSPFLPVNSSPPDPSFPRLLFITPGAFNNVTGTGITFSNLFAGWPKDRIATVHNDAVPTATDICERYYRLGPNEIRRWVPVPAAIGGEPGTDRVAAVRRNPLLRAAKELLFGNGLPDFGHLTPDLERWIADYRPHVLFTILGSVGMLELVEFVRRRFDLPLIVHFMDDWSSAVYRGGLLSPLVRVRMNRLLSRLVDAATLRLAIGGDMAREYESRYGVPFRPFQNAVDPSRRSAAIRKTDAGATAIPARILYVGSVFDNAQAASLVDCVRAVAALADRGRAIRFDIHSPLFLAERLRTDLEIASCIRLHDAIADDGLFFKTIAEADILLLPMNFDDASWRYVRLSMPTKLPAYLFSGTPILAYGPAGAAQIEHVRRHGAGLVADRPGVESLAGDIARLLDDSALRRDISVRALKLAAHAHDLRKVRAEFQRVLCAGVPPT